MRSLRFSAASHPRRGVRAAFGISLATLLLRSVPALAAGNEAAAEALFLEAKRLSTEGKFSEACPKFAESNRLDRGAGTLIHLGDCYEKNHQLASAWATYREAASAAQGLGRGDWEKLASTRAAALEPKLAKLTIRVLEPAEKIEVSRDGAATSPASWGVAIPVDVGAHRVEASAPGRKGFTTTIAINHDGDREVVIVPKLAAQPGAAASARSPAAADPPANTQRTIGFVVGGVGIAGLAVGAVTGLIAIGKNNDSKKTCPKDGVCTSRDAVDAADSARQVGTISTIAFIAGGVGTALGVVLVLTAPSSTPERSGATARRAQVTPPARGLRLVPSSDGQSAAMSLFGVF